MLEQVSHPFVRCFVSWLHRLAYAAVGLMVIERVSHIVSDSWSLRVFDAVAGQKRLELVRPAFVMCFVS